MRELNLLFVVAGSVALAVPVSAQDGQEVELTHTMAIDPWATEDIHLAYKVDSSQAVGDSVGQLGDASTGSPVASVSVASSEDCSGPARLTGFGSEEVCLLIENVPSATSASGKLALGDDTLELTVNTHHPFWAPGLAGVTAAMLGGGAMFLFQTQYTKSKHRRRRDHAAAATKAAGVTGVDEWLTASAIHLSHQRQAELLEHVKNNRLAQRRQEALALTEAIDELRSSVSPVPDLAVAVEIADRPPAMDEFYQPTGSTTDSLPTEWKTVIGKLSLIGRQLNDIDQYVDEAGVWNEREKVREARDRLGGDFESLDLRASTHSLELDQLIARASDLHDDAARLTPIRRRIPPHQRERVAVTIQEPALAASGDGPTTVELSSLWVETVDKGRSLFREVLAFLLTPRGIELIFGVVVILVAALIGVGSVSANPSFGAVADYVTLAGSLFGGSVVVTGVGAWLSSRAAQ